MKIDKEELEKESVWILKHIPEIEDPNIIAGFLNLYINSKTPVMTIAYFHPHIVPNIQLPLLWKMADLDLKWVLLEEKKKKLRNKFSLLQKSPSGEQDELLEEFFTSTQSLDANILNYINDKLDFIGTKSNMSYDFFTSFDFSRSLPLRKDLPSFFESQDLPNLKKGFLTVRQVIENIQKLLDLNNDTKANYVPKMTASPEYWMRKFWTVNERNDFSLLPSKLVSLMAFEIYLEPFIRITLKSFYLSRLRIATEATMLGKEELDAAHPLFQVKRIQNMPIKEFNNETWVLIEEAERLNLIKVKFNMRNQDNLADESKEASEVNDDLFQLLYKAFACLDPQGDHANDSQLVQWQKLRANIIREMLRDYFYPSIKTEIRTELKENGEIFIASKWQRILQKEISASPSSFQKLLSVTYEHHTQNIIVLEVNSSLEKNNLHEGISNFSLCGPHEGLQKKIIEADPDFIIVPSSCSQVNSIQKIFLALVESLPEPKKIRVLVVKDYLTTISIKVEKVNDSINSLIHEAFCLAKYFKDPLDEILKVSSHNPNDNGIFHIPFHSYQKYVRTKLLQEKLEETLIEVVNTIGINYSEIANDRFVEKFSYISGFGPSTAFKILEILKEEKILNRIDYKKALASYPCLYNNSVGFVKFNKKAASLLDSLKIHPKCKISFLFQIILWPRICVKML